MYSETPGRVPTVISVFAALTKPLPDEKDTDAYVREIVERRYGSRRGPRIRASQVVVVDGFIPNPSVNDVKALYEELSRRKEIRDYGSPDDGDLGLTRDFHPVAALFFWHDTKRRWGPFGNR